MPACSGARTSRAAEPAGIPVIRPGGKPFSRAGPLRDDGQMRFLDPRRWWSDAVTADRLLLVGKTAAAATLAWYLAPLVPFAQSEYSYYAPLGVLVSMYPTIARSATTGLQTLTGLALGIGLGLAAQLLVGAGMPRIVAVAATVGLGVLLAGVRALGPGRDWVAIAGLFVLLLGGADPDGFSSSYLLTTAFGVLVGVVVNLVVVPPLHLRRADERLDHLRDGLAEALREMSKALAGRTFDPATARRAAAGLADTLAEVREEVDLADESLRYNPRGRRLTVPRGERRHRLEALAVTAEATRDLVTGLTALTDVDDVDQRLPGDARRTLANAIASASRLVATEPESDRLPGLLRDARATLDAYAASLQQLAGSRREPYAVAIDRWEAAASLRRLIEAVSLFIEEEAPPA